MNGALILLLFSLAAPGFSPVIPASAAPAAKLVKIQVLGSKRFKEARTRLLIPVADVGKRSRGGEILSLPVQQSCLVHAQGVTG